MAKVATMSTAEHTQVKELQNAEPTQRKHDKYKEACHIRYIALVIQHVSSPPPPPSSSLIKQACLKMSSTSLIPHSLVSFT